MFSIKTKLSGAEILTKTLESAGIETVFGFPGESSLPFYASLAKSQQINNVVARTELCSGFMADAYVRFSQKITICHAPGGIGSPQLLPGIVETYNSSIPVVFMSFSEPQAQRGKWSTSTFDHNTFSLVVKQAFVLNSVDDIQTVVSQAIATASTPRTGPVHVDIPCNLLEEEAEWNPNLKPVCGVYPSQRPLPGSEDLTQIKTLAKRLLQAQRPVIYAGGGGFLSDAGKLIQTLAETVGAVVVTTLNGKGVVPETHPHNFGVAGQKGADLGNQCFELSDLVVIMGSKTGDKSTLSWRLCKKVSHSAQIDADSREVGRNFNTELNVVGDLATVVELLLKEIEAIKDVETPRPLWLIRDRQQESKSDSSQEEDSLIRTVMQELSTHYSAFGLMVTDASQASGWGGKYYQCVQKQRSFISPRGTGTIGYAMPAAIGAHLARRETPIVAIGGDGGLLMSLHEMETAKRLQVPLLFVLLDNRALGLLNEHLRLFHESEGALPEFTDMRWDYVAKAFGWSYLEIKEESQVKDTIVRAQSEIQPCLLKVVCSAVRSPDFHNTLKIKQGN